MLAIKISNLLSSRTRSLGLMDDWHRCSYELRKFLRGWSRNHAAEERRAKKSLETQIEGLDRTADTLSLSEAGWSLRYNLEAALM